jgi:nucleoside-diphosphate-sugar epimerase
MRVAVTGHHGYIGSVLAPLLRAAGHDIVGFDTFLYEGCDFGESDPFEPSQRLDVRDVSTDALRGFDAVVHLAALSNDPVGDLNSDWTVAINGDATVSLARAARSAGVRRFIFASSCSMYGAAEGDSALDESAPLRPLTAYAESKVAAEAGLRELAGDDFLPISMRNATVYGVSPRLRLDVVLNNLVAWADTTGSIRMQSDGTPWRPLVHVRDVARAALALLTAPAELVGGEAFNVGSADQNYRIGELAEIVQQRLPECDITYADGAGSDPRSYRVDFSKLESTLPDFHCEWGAERGADELARAFAEIGLSADDLHGDRFLRLGRIKALLVSGSLDSRLRWTSLPGGTPRPRE